MVARAREVRKRVESVSLQDEKILVLCCITMCIQLTLLDCTLKYSGRSQFYVTHTHTHTHTHINIMVKNPPAMQETQVQSLSWEDALEKGMATHSSILAWRIPWAEEPGSLTIHGVAKRCTRLSN